MWKESPIIGYGPGSWFVVYPRFAAAAARAPDRVSDANTSVQAAADGEAIGFGLFVLLLAALIYRIAQARSAMGLALVVFVVVAASLANFKLSILFLLLGAGLGDCLMSSRSKPPRLVSPSGVRSYQLPGWAGRRLVPLRFVNSRKRRPVVIC